MGENAGQQPRSWSARLRRRGRAFVMGFVALTASLVAAACLAALGASHLLGGAAALCASDRWLPWAASGDAQLHPAAETGFSLAPLGLTCTYPHFADASPVVVYPDEPLASQLLLAVVLTGMLALFLLAGLHRRRPRMNPRRARRTLIAAAAASGAAVSVFGAAALGTVYALGKNGWVLSCAEYAPQPIGSVGDRVVESTLGGVTAEAVLVPTGILCGYPRVTGATPSTSTLEVFGAGTLPSWTGLAALVALELLVFVLVAARATRGVGAVAGSGIGRPPSTRSAAIAGALGLVTPVVLAVALFAGSAVLTPQLSHTQPAQQQALASDSEQMIEAAPSGQAPAFVVVHRQSDDGPGAIDVVDTQTGEVLQRLGAAFDPYLMNGFQLSPDGTTLYYTRLNEPAQTIEIVAAPTSGAPAAVVADGSDPQLSPDGSLLAFHGQQDASALVVRDLATGATTETHVPGMTDGLILQYAFIPDSRSLYVSTTQIPAESACDVPYGHTCGPSTVAPVAPAAFILSIDAQTWTPVPPTHESETSAERLTLFGPGWQSGSVLAWRASVLPDGTAGDVFLVAIDTATGTELWKHSLPVGTNPAGRDPTGSNLLLFAGPDAAAGEGLVAWTPASGALTPLPGTGVAGGNLDAPAVSEAAW